ncbi:hypothetical protein MMC16_003513 [Acarospora aff. strigata]|nr:hypothetical protein [Acarospora aff. strigata]
MPPLNLPRDLIPSHLPHLNDLLAPMPHLSRRDLTLPKLHFPDLSFPSPLPTRTSEALEPRAKSFRTVSSLIRRQTVVAIPTTYSGLDAGPPPANIIGIVLGSVAGFLLILWLLYTCSNMGGGGEAVGEEVVTRRRSRSPRRSSRSRSEMMESRRSRSPLPPPRRESRRETIIVEDRRAPAPMPMPMPAPAPIILEREDDIVEVIEEHSPPPRVRSSRDRNSGYRPVDADLYAGGNRPIRKVSRR